jgi:hypothetical protein
VSASKGWVAALPGGVSLLLEGLQFAVLSLAAAGLYHYVPNTAVRWRHAMAGGVFVAAAFEIVKRLLDTGISLHNIRVAVDHLRKRGVQDLANITLFSDGTSVYECTSAEEVVDLLQGGQGVFGIAVSGAMRELTGDIADFPGERADGGESIPSPEDELASRRKSRDRKIG